MRCFLLVFVHVLFFGGVRLSPRLTSYTDPYFSILSFLLLLFVLLLFCVCVCVCVCVRACMHACVCLCVSPRLTSYTDPYLVSLLSQSLSHYF